MTETHTELKPIKVTSVAPGSYSPKLFFYTQEDNKLYTLKNEGRHRYLQTLGSCRNIYVTQDDLVDIGTLEQFQTDKFYIYYL